MEPLYKTSMKQTYEEFVKFNKTAIRRDMIRVYVFLFLVFLGGVIYSKNNPDKEYVDLIILVFILLYILIIKILNIRTINKAYDTNETLKNSTVEIYFYEKEFFVKTENAEATVEYKKLHKILENKTNFYLMISNNMGYMVLKANCSKKLIDFILDRKNELIRRNLMN